MRSVAVLLVAVSHLLLYTGYVGLGGFSGVTGVCLFFVHTSLVLMGSLERDPHVGRFYVRRIFRIYPLWLVVLGLSLALAIPTSPTYAPVFRAYVPHLREGIENALLIINMTGNANVVGASWSLPIEMQMYLLLPMLFALVRMFRTVWPLLVIDGFVMLYDKYTLPPSWGTLPMCIPFFLPGVMAYVMYGRTRLRQLPSWLFPVFLLLLIASNHWSGNFRRSWLVCLALGLGLPLFRQIESNVVRRVSALVARYSYGIYLTHLWAICLGVHTLAGRPMPVRVGVFLVALVGLPVAFYHAVERPCIRLGSRLAAKLERGPEPRADERMMRMEPAP